MHASQASQPSVHVAPPGLTIDPAKVEVDGQVRKELNELKKQLTDSFNGAARTKERLAELKKEKICFDQGKRPSNKRKPGMSLVNTASGEHYHPDGDECFQEITVNCGES